MQDMSRIKSQDISINDHLLLDTTVVYNKKNTYQKHYAYWNTSIAFTT